MEYIEEILKIIKLIVDIIAVGVLTYGVMATIFKLVKCEIFEHAETKLIIRHQAIRPFLGTYIILGLEFLIVADIIETIINPTLYEILILGLVVFIRTVISFFLDKEIEHADKFLCKKDLSED